MPARILIATSTFLALSLVGCSNPNFKCPSTTGGTPGTVGTAPSNSGGTISAYSGCPSPASAALVYSLNANATVLSAAALNNAGSLVRLNTFRLPTLPITGAKDMVIVNKSFLYLPMGDTTIRAFSIDRSTGELSEIAGSPYSVPTTTGTASRAVAGKDGQFLFVGSAKSGEVWVYEISATTGALTLVAGSPFTVQHTFVAADSLAVDASGRFLYVGQVDPARGIMAFTIDPSTGALTQVTGSPFHLGVAQLQAHAGAEFLLGTAQILDQSGPAAPDPNIYVFSVTSNGIPTQVFGSPFRTTYAPYDLTILPNEGFVFTFGVDLNTGMQGAIEGFQLNSSTGALTAMSGSPFVGLPKVYSCRSEQSGAHAFCANGRQGTVFSVLSVDSSTGALSPTGNDLTVDNTFLFAVTN